VFTRKKMTSWACACGVADVKCIVLECFVELAKVPEGMRELLNSGVASAVSQVIVTTTLYIWHVWYNICRIYTGCSICSIICIRALRQPPWLRASFTPGMTVSPRTLTRCVSVESRLNRARVAAKTKLLLSAIFSKYSPSNILLGNWAKECVIPGITVIVTTGHSSLPPLR